MDAVNYEPPEHMVRQKSCRKRPESHDEIGGTEEKYELQISPNIVPSL